MKEFLETEFPIFPERALEKTIEILGDGSLPLIITIPHDGDLSELDGVQLPYQSSQGKRDLAVRKIGYEIYHFMAERYGKTPIFINQLVHRRRMTPQITEFYNDIVMKTLKSSIYQKNLLFIDLHGCTKQPYFGTYDLIAGTAHRRTVKESTLDYDLEAFLTQRGYKVYIPSVIPKEGEVWGATLERTLMQKMLRANLPHVVGMQIEIARWFRTPEDNGIAKGTKLSSNLADCFYYLAEKAFQRNLSYIQLKTAAD